MENLNKENFWNEMQAKYPLAMADFCSWIDKYKESVKWNQLFNSDSNWQDSDGKNAPAPKFHDLPLAIQMGIWKHYLGDHQEREIDIIKNEIEAIIRGLDEGMNETIKQAAFEFSVDAMDKFKEKYKHLIYKDGK